MITREWPMYKVVLENLQLLPLLPRFNLNPGFGEKSVDEVCRDHGVNTDFFLEIANAYLDELYVPEGGLSLFSEKGWRRPFPWIPARRRTSGQRQG